ncbi:MAG: hypothetical protein RMJ51_00480 [Candidatus Calescibacterium sp.]|nr:hypothetical protein [Candidatus Calescibacterium sp.]MDW8194709.1 hypothetical protein [Candidatus Calescibacterium sp.]
MILKHLLAIIFIIILTITPCLSINTELIHINFNQHIYKLIPSQDYIIHDYKVLPDNNILIFYQDKSEKNLNKNFISVIDAKNKKTLKVIPTEMVRYKESITDENGNTYIISWKPVDLYFFDYKNNKISKIHNNQIKEGQENFIITLDSKLIKSANGDIFLTMDIKKQKEISEDVVICKIENQNNSLKIIPYFSLYSISVFFKDQPYKMIINYPSNIFINSIKNNKLYNISTNGKYEGKKSIDSITTEIPSITNNLFDANKNYILISTIENNKSKLTIFDYKNNDKIHIQNEKFIQAKFLSENEVLFSSLENKKIKFQIFNISERKLTPLQLTDIKSANFGIVNNNTFFCFNKNNIYIVNIKR